MCLQHMSWEVESARGPRADLFSEALMFSTNNIGGSQRPHPSVNMTAAPARGWDAGKIRGGHKSYLEESRAATGHD